MSYPTITLEVGKRYVARNGDVVGPLDRVDSAFYPFVDRENRQAYASNGRLWLGEESPQDLVAPVAGGVVQKRDAGSVLRTLVETLERELDIPEAPAAALEAVRTARHFLNNQPR